MEDVLKLSAEPDHPQRPKVCFDELSTREPSNHVMQKVRVMAGWQRPIVVWLVALAYILWAGLIGITLVPALIGWRSDGIPSPLQFETPNLANMFARWDSGYYLSIVQNGYSPTGAERAFFPLYPLIVRWLSQVSGLSPLVNGMILSIACFGGVVFFFYLWVFLDHGQELAVLATILLCFSPVAYYFIAFYAEALFLLTSIMSLYFARRGWFLASGVAIALAGATRPTAFLLGFAYIFECLQHRPLSRWGWLSAIAGAIVAPMGALAYFAYLGQSHGLLAGMTIYNSLLGAEWHTYMAWPWELVADATKAILLGTGIGSTWFSWFYSLLDSVFALAGLALSIWALRRLRLSTAVFVLASVGYVFLLHGPGGQAFDSSPRHIGTIIPLYLAAAMLIAQRQWKYRWAVAAASALWLGVLAAWFSSGRWVS